MDENKKGVRVVVFGATGLAGSGVVQAWLSDPRVEKSAMFSSEE